MPDIKIKFQRPSGAGGGIHLDVVRFRTKAKWGGETVNIVPQNGSDPFTWQWEWKENQAWPFDGIEREIWGDEKTPGSIKTGIGNGTFHGSYYIHFYFQDDDGQITWATIDPDMEIGT